ncbi:MAG: DNA polymerase III subunit alpha [Candidatus Eremiobacteraeota bacterium]|nr:DNA polymerase III subunit alpha [Candidatus Eremiobacteraeota bacterium]
MNGRYAELHAHSNFTLLDGGSHPEELIAGALAHELAAIAITDRDGLYGAVRFAQAGRECDMPAIIGAELTLEDDSHLVVLVENARGYANVSRLISRARLGSPRGKPQTSYELLSGHARGLVALSGCHHGAIPKLLERGDFRGACVMAARLRDIFGWGALWIELQRHFEPDDGPRIRALDAVARELELGMVVTGGVHYVSPDHRELADVLTCIRLGTTLEHAGTQLRPNGEYYLRSPAAMAQLFPEHPRAIANSVALAERCTFRLRKLENEFPDFPLPPGETSFSYLYRLVHEGVQQRYRPVTSEVSRQIAHELSVIEKLDLAGYFLIVWDLVRFARERGILVQGRGSAANSAVCYALGITSVDPVGLKLLFERFLSEERDEPPDIDLDTPSGDEREQIIQYIYQRYGRDHAGMVAEVISYRARSAVRDIGKALGLSLDQVDALAKSLDTHAASGVGDEVEGVQPSAPPEPEASTPLHEQLQVTKHGEHLPLTATDVENAVAALPQALRVDLRGDVAARLYALCRRIDGFPRHLSQHVGGMVITRSPLIEIAPLEPAAMADRTILCWDKDDCATLGLIKIDILGLGMLDAIELALADIGRSRGTQIDITDLRACDDPQIYDMLCEADTVGLFQVESRAQMATLPRLRPRCFYDVVVQVAIIRPGPIQGDMVHPYIRRRRGLEPVTYPHPSLRPVLERTLGVPLFQEQGMRLAVEAAGFTPGQADELRRAMGHKRSREKMAKLHGRLRDGMRRNGIAADIADRLFHMLSAFADYGFPESHAASFALIVYLSAYLKRYYAPEFYAALLNAQPMGFYSPATLIGDARRHNVCILAPDVNASRFACTVEPMPEARRPAPDGAAVVTHAWEHPVALRIGLSQVRGIGDKHKAMLDAERERGPYRDLRDFVMRTRLPKDVLESLASVGAFGCFDCSRRSAFWDVQRLSGLGSAGELERQMTVDEPQVALPPMRAREEAAADYRGLGLSTRYQIIEFYRPQLDALRVRRACDLPALPNRLVLKVAGIVTTRQRPGTAKGFVFTTMEDETGLVNVIIRPDVYQRYRPIARDEPTVVVEGVLQRQDGHVNVLARRFWKLDSDGLAHGLPARDFH